MPFFHMMMRRISTATTAAAMYTVLFFRGFMVMGAKDGIGGKVGGIVVAAIVVGASVMGLRAEISPSINKLGATGRGNTTPPVPEPNPGL